MRKTHLESAMSSLAGYLATAFLLGMPIASHAVPSLGVGTSTGSYICDGGDYSAGTCPDDYQLYYGGSIYEGPYRGADEGWIIGPSGDDLIVWTSILSSDIWLLTDDTTYSNHTPTIDGSSLTELTGTGQFDGYKPTPYWGINLGPVTTTGGDVNIGWTELPQPPFSPPQPGFYSLSVELAYVGTIPPGTYFFAVADSNGTTGLQANSGNIRRRALSANNSDLFSPKTTSAVTIPEPGTLSLFGLGAIVIGIAGRRRRQKAHSAKALGRS